MGNKQTKICLISSSGGHYEQLKMLEPLSFKYDTFWITEDADYDIIADYFMRQTSPNKLLNLYILLINLKRSLIIWLKERPDFVITTGTIAAFPIAVLAKIFRKKLIYIETFARIHDGTRAGKLAYKHADLFIVQWKNQKKIYPNAVYGGSIY